MSDIPVIEVKSSQVETKSGTSRAGNPYTIRKQRGLFRVGEEIRVVEIPLSDAQPPYEPGRYTPSVRSYSVGDFGALILRRLVLVPLPKAA